MNRISKKSGEVYIAILDSDEDYISRFSEYINQRPIETIHIIFFTAENLFSDFINENNNVLAIIAENLFEETNIQYDNSKTVLLCECADVVSINSIDTIYKYQKIETVINKLINFFLLKISTEQKNAIVKKRDSLIIGIYSPINRCGKTSLAVQIGEKLSDQNKVLLINFDEFSPLSGMFGYESKEDLSDIGNT